MRKKPFGALVNGWLSLPPRGEAEGTNAPCSSPESARRWTVRNVLNSGGGRKLGRAHKQAGLEVLAAVVTFVLAPNLFCRLQAFDSLPKSIHDRFPLGASRIWLWNPSLTGNTNELAGGKNYLAEISPQRVKY